MGMHVDKPGRYGQPVCLQHQVGAAAQIRSDGGDFPVAQGDVSPHRRFSVSGIDPAVFDEGVEATPHPAGTRSQQRERRGSQEGGFQE